jgi:16S rRNA (uracil1498-N3)-methyltransferase
VTTTVVVTPIEFDGTEFELHGETYHRFVRVKRLRGGESVRVVDGEGRARRGVVARLDRSRCVIALAGGEPSRESPLRVELVVAPPEPSRAAWLVEKATELGVTAVSFVATARSERDEDAYNATQLARLRRIALAAVEQCGRSLVPEIGGVRPLAEVLAQLPSPPPTEAPSPASQKPLFTPVPGETTRIVLDPSGEGASDLVGLTEERCPRLRLRLFVGPEGGFEVHELAAFDAVGAARVALGERILRVETAAVVAAGLALTTFR